MTPYILEKCLLRISEGPKKCEELRIWTSKQPKDHRSCLTLAEDEGFTVARALIEFVFYCYYVYCIILDQLIAYIRSLKNASSADKAYYSNFESLILNGYSILLSTFDIISWFTRVGCQVYACTTDLLEIIFLGHPLHLQLNFLNFNSIGRIDISVLGKEMNGLISEIIN